MTPTPDVTAVPLVTATQVLGASWYVVLAIILAVVAGILVVCLGGVTAAALWREQDTGGRGSDRRGRPRRPAERPDV